MHIRVGRWWIGTMIRLMDKIWRTSSYGWISVRHVWSVRKNDPKLSTVPLCLSICALCIQIFVYIVVIQLVVYVDGLPFLESLVTSGRLFLGDLHQIAVFSSQLGNSLAKGAWSGLVKLEIVHVIVSWWFWKTTKNHPEQTSFPWKCIWKSRFPQPLMSPKYPKTEIWCVAGGMVGCGWRHEAGLMAGVDGRFDGKPRAGLIEGWKCLPPPFQRPGRP